MRHNLFAAFVVLCSTTVSAQVPPGHWTSWLFGLGPGNCGVCAYDPSGSQVAGVSVTIFGGGAVAKSPAGVVWVADSSAGVVRAVTPTGQVGTVIAPGVNQVAVTSAADLVIATGGLFTSVSVSQFDSTGIFQWTTSLGSGLPVALRVDGASQTWVANGLAPELRILSPSGVASPAISVGPGQIRGLDVDAFGRAFVLVAPGGGSTVPLTLRRLDSTGTTTGSTMIADAAFLSLDACGRIQVLVNTGATSQSILVYEPDGLTLIALIPLVMPSTYTTFTMDAVGNYFLSNVQLSRLDVASPLGVYSATISSIATSGEAGIGDATGLRLVSVIDPNGDADLDGVSNRRELWNKSDPFSATSVPPTLALSGIPAGGNTITLTRQSPTEAGLAYVLGASFGTAGIFLGPVDCRTIPLTLDAFLLFWIDPTNIFASGVFGGLDPSGVGVTTVNFPPIPLTGLTLHFSMIVFQPLSPSGVGSITDVLSVTLL